MRLLRRLLFLFALASAVFAFARPAVSASEAVITYRKIFKGSVPESVEIKISETGKCTFDIRQLAEDPSAQAFEVGQPVRDKIFSLAKELNYFRNQDLDVHRKIANLGAKTFRYEKDGAANEVTFNYTLNTPASQLLRKFLMWACLPAGSPADTSAHSEVRSAGRVRCSGKSGDRPGEQYSSGAGAPASSAGTNRK